MQSTRAKLLLSLLVFGFLSGSVLAGYGHDETEAEGEEEVDEDEGEDDGERRHLKLRRLLEEAEMVPVTYDDTSCVWDIVDSDPNLSSFKVVADMANVTEPLSTNSAEWTVLIPTNDAFSKLCKNKVLGDYINELDEDVLVRLLEYHIIPGDTLLLADLQELNEPTVVPTWLGKDEQLAFNNEDGTVTVESTSSNSAEVLDADLRPQDKSCKVVVHVISEVMVPDILVKDL